MKSERAKLQHRPFMTPIWLLGMGAFAAFCFAVAALWVLVTANSTTVVVITEPETAARDSRAALLALMFGNKGAGGLDAIYVASAQSSAAPLAAKLGVVATITPTLEPERLVRTVLDRNSGGRAMIVCSALAVAPIVTALSRNRELPVAQPIEADVMYIVTVPRIGHANLLRLSY